MTDPSEEPRDPESAAHEAVAPDRLLPGEDPSSRHLDDVVHWVTVYAELVEFKQAMLAAARARMQSMPEAAAREVAVTDIAVMEAEGERLRRRLSFWRERAQERSQS